MKEKILVVDDQKLNVRLLTQILEDEAYEVFSADNGLPVVDLAQQHHPDVILLDVMMPGLDGFEVCRLLKAQEDVRDIPVIMVTAMTEGAEIKKALEYGAFDYIKKPIDEIEVVARVQSALRHKKQQDLMKELAIKDGLTGLYNHALLMELLERELAKLQRNQGELAFVMLDIDHFKSVNDNYGHLAGNQVLIKLAEILRTSVRKGDIVARYGGEEFSLVLPGMPKQDVWKFCDRIRAKIEQAGFEIDGKGLSQSQSEGTSITVTVSMGIFHQTADDTISGYEIIKKSDEALYRAKATGRNRVESYSHFSNI